MANRRMFSLKVIDTDSFLDMSPTAQLLYFHLAMRADDDGFVSSPKKIMKLANAADDDMRVLIAKKYLIPFESGVCVIKDWKIHNYIQSDRYQETEYREEKALLLENNGKYEVDTERIHNVSKVLPQVRLELGKVRIGKDRKEIDILPSHVGILDKKETQEKLISQFPGVDVLEEIEKMKDWVNASGKRKRDYPAFARNWLRKVKGEKKVKSNDRTNL